MKMGVLDNLYSIFGKEAIVSVVGLNAVFSAAYWVVGGLFLIVDLTGKPEWFLKFKTQPGKNEPVDPDDLKKVLKCIVFNHLTIGVPASFIFYFLMRWRDCDQSLRLPTFSSLVFQVILLVLTEEVGFFYSHWALHSNYLYKTVHKQHHEFQAPFGIVSAYAHPVEFVFSNLTPLLTGPILWRTPMVTTWIWFFAASSVTVIHHSGYHLPFCFSPEFHDFHHLKFVGNYGVLGILDWLHGTDRAFRNSLQYQRHGLIVSASQMLFK